MPDTGHSWKGQRFYNAGFEAGKRDQQQPTPGAPVPPDDLATFTEWFRRNYPGPDTIIHKPEWHAPKVFRAAQHAINAQAIPEREKLIQLLNDLAWFIGESPLEGALEMQNIALAAAERLRGGGSDG